MVACSMQEHFKQRECIRSKNWLNGAEALCEFGWLPFWSLEVLCGCTALNFESG